LRQRFENNVKWVLRKLYKEEDYKESTKKKLIFEKLIF
jgi:hypothetical protein